MSTIEIHPRKIARNTNFRREVSYTSLRVFHLAVPPSSTAAPNIATAVEYALKRVALRPALDWFRLSRMDPSEFGVPEWLPCGSRYVTSLSLSPVVDSALQGFVANVLAPEFTALNKRVPYRPFAIALLFRAVIADELGILPFKVAQSEPVPYDSDMLEVLYSNGGNLPDGFEIIE